MEEGKVVSIKPDKLIQVGVFQIDLAKLTPLTLGDQEELAKPPYNVNFRDPGKNQADDVNLVWFILRKVEPQVTREAVAMLSTRVGTVIMQYFTRLSAEEDIPLGLLPPPPMPSRGITAGDSKK